MTLRLRSFEPKNGKYHRKLPGRCRGAAGRPRARSVLCDRSRHNRLRRGAHAPDWHGCRKSEQDDLSTSAFKAAIEQAIGDVFGRDNIPDQRILFGARGGGITHMFGATPPPSRLSS